MLTVISTSGGDSEVILIDHCVIGLFHPSVMNVAVTRPAVIRRHPSQWDRRPKVDWDP